MFVVNGTPIPRHNYRVGVPEEGLWQERLNSDAEAYGGSGVGNYGEVETTPVPYHGRPSSVVLTLPPLAVVVLERTDGPADAASGSGAVAEVKDMARPAAAKPTTAKKQAPAPSESTKKKAARRPATPVPKTRSESGPIPPGTVPDAAPSSSTSGEKKPASSPNEGGAPKKTAAKESAPDAGSGRTSAE